MKNLLNIWKHKGQILEGIRNSIFKQKDIEEVAAYRNSVCQRCPAFDEKGHACAMPGSQPCCGECGCSLKFKTRSLSSSCPRGYWNAVLSEEEEAELLHHLQNNPGA